jgi:hypothetical protein
MRGCAGRIPGLNTISQGVMMKVSRTVKVSGAAFFAGFVTALVAAIVVSKGRKNSLRGARVISGELEDMLGI